MKIIVFGTISMLLLAILLTGCQTDAIGKAYVSSEPTCATWKQLCDGGKKAACQNLKSCIDVYTKSEINSINEDFNKKIETVQNSLNNELNKEIVEVAKTANFSAAVIGSGIGDFVTCPSGKEVISGGCVSSSAPSKFVLHGFQATKSNQNLKYNDAWMCSFSATETGTYVYQIMAYCK